MITNKFQYIRDQINVKCIKMSLIDCCLASSEHQFSHIIDENR